MPHKFFLSHYNEDKEIAEMIAKLLHRLSLQQLQPWFSSDISDNGGLRPGNIWFNEILLKIAESKALISILTPNSIDRPWIFFESGVGQALQDCEVIPVSIGLKRDAILPPLGMYQCYQLTDYNSLKEFIGKLLRKFDVVFDEEMSRPVLINAVKELGKIDFEQKPNVQKSINMNDLLSEIKNHVDRRFLDLMESKNESAPSPAGSVTILNPVIYTSTIKVLFSEFKGDKFIEIRENSSVQSALDSIYFLLGSYIKPYTYMEKWILTNPKTKERLILREIGHMVPAKLIFKPDIVWEASKIDEEYKASSSTEIMNSIRP